MTGIVAYLVSFGAGIVSFASPCVLPLVPVYLSVVTGLDVSELEAGRTGHLRSAARNSALFVVGFSAVFVLLGSTASALGRVVLSDHALLTKVAGAIVIAMAVFLAGSQFVSAPRLYGERRVHLSSRRWGPLAAPITGAAFAAGWTPCVGPVLASVLAVAGAQGNVGHGAALLALYSLGLGVPFLVTGLALSQVAGASAWLRCHLRAVTLCSAVLMAAFGALVLFGRLAVLNGASELI